MKADRVTHAKFSTGLPTPPARPLAAAMFAVLVALAAAPAAAQPLEAYPKIWGGRTVGEEVPREVRFLTDNDYPPFNYIDEDGQLAGFNIDMARAICTALKLVCTIEARPWDELIPALEAEEANAVIASLATTAENRRRVIFTDSYYRTPARFVVRSDSDLEVFTPGGLAGRRVGVLQDTAHEAYLRDFFADSVIVTYEDHAAARGALRFGKIDALFGDGVSLMFWLNGASSRRCCVFRGGAFTEARYFGEGVGIAVGRDDGKLAALLSLGIALTKANGDYDELLLRYFPMSMY